MAKSAEKLSLVRIKLVISLLLLASGCNNQSQMATGENHQAPAIKSLAQSFPAADYQSTLKNLAAERLQLAEQYQQAANQIARKEILEKAREKFVASIDKEIFPFWDGTDWDFYGTTEQPGKGKIACGYFVTTVLRDAGVRVNRVSLAQQASENIIKSLTSEPHIRRFRNASIKNFVAEIRQTGGGLYVVGLDFHVGFILHDNAEVYFIHSSYVEPSEVIREKAVESTVLANSKYRVVGNISGDDQLLIKWLKQQSIPTLRR